MKTTLYPLVILLLVLMNCTRNEDSQMPVARLFLGVSVTETEKGLAVKSIAPNSMASKADIRMNDQLVAVNNNEVTDAASAIKLFNALLIGQEMHVRILREDSLMDMSIPLALEFGDVIWPRAQAGKKCEFEGESCDCISALPTDICVSYYKFKGWDDRGGMRLEHYCESWPTADAPGNNRIEKRCKVTDGWI